MRVRLLIPVVLIALPLDGKAKAGLGRDSIQLGVGDEYVCVPEGEDLKCAGTNRGVVGNVPRVRGPRTLSAGSYHACVPARDGVRCWVNNENGQTNVPFLGKGRI